MSVPAPIRWENGRLLLLDQRQLPGRVVFEEQTDVGCVVRAIRQLRVRGAPAIGVAAAYAMAMAWRDGDDLEQAAADLSRARPTAVNLAWAVDRMLVALSCGTDLVEEARAIHEEDRAMCEAIGRHGAPLIKPGSRVLTHCNAGALAVSHLGTATAPMYLAHEAGVRFHVYVDETRPVLQGSRLTSWELTEAGIDHTLICDSAAAHLMADGGIDLIIVGADRVTANGDTVNKIGTRRARDRGQLPRCPVLRRLSVLDPGSGDSHRGRRGHRGAASRRGHRQCPHRGRGKSSQSRVRRDPRRTGNGVCDRIRRRE